MSYSNTRLLGAAVALALSSQAQAFTDPATATTRVFISGASAPTHMLREQVVQNLCDGTQPVDVFVDGVNIAPAGAAQILNHTSAWTVQCIGSGLNGAPTGNLLIAKTDAGGSGNGVQPVANATALNFLNTGGAGCQGAAAVAAVAGDGTTAYNLRTCPAGNTTLSQIPDMGVSDVEPDKFSGELTTAGALVPPANWQVETGPGLTFGVVITTAFRNELQTDQVASGLLAAGCVGLETEACMPSLPSWYVRSLYAGKVGNWNSEEVYGGVLNQPAGYNARVHLCRRVTGSGTHAQHMINYHRTNCQAGTAPMLSQPGGALGQPFVYETSSSGNMDQCLSALANNTTTTNTVPAIAVAKQSFTIGYQSLEKNGNNSLPYRFVKIDGVAPTLKNVWEGSYEQVYFLSYNHRELDFRTGAARAALLAGEDTRIEGVIDGGFDITGSVASQINAGFTQSFGTAGFVVLPTAASPAPAAFNAANPVVPYARLKLDGITPDSCAPLFRK